MDPKVETFAGECRAILSKDSSPAALEQVRLVLEKYLADDEFVDTHLGPDFEANREVLYEDPELGFCICRHVFKGANEAPPHDHGPSWAIYGQAKGHTTMTEFEKLAAPSGEEPGKAKPTKTYDLDPGMAVAYPKGALHSPKREGDTRLIRIEGADVTKMKREKYQIA
jgi:predicted metal-dependent enzyme (double-stranded beta helix superfamily)